MRRDQCLCFAWNSRVWARLNSLVPCATALVSLEGDLLLRVNLNLLFYPNTVALRIAPDRKLLSP